jgi:hypothetical protein
LTWCSGRESAHTLRYARAIEIHQRNSEPTHAGSYNDPRNCSWMNREPREPCEKKRPRPNSHAGTTSPNG